MGATVYCMLARPSHEVLAERDERLGRRPLRQARQVSSNQEREQFV